MGVIRRETKKSKNGSFSHYLDISYGGRRWTETVIRVSKSDDKKAKKIFAESVRTKRIAELESAEHGLTPNFKKNIQVLTYCDDFVANYKKGDLRVVEGSIKKFRLFLQQKNISEKISFKMLNEKIIHDFMTFLNYEANISGVTPLNYFKKFKMILLDAKRGKIVNEEIYAEVKFKSRGDTSEKSLTKNVLTQDEIELLWDTPCGNDEVKKAFLFGCYTGLTFQEMFILKWGEIDIDIVDTKRVKNQIQIKNMISARMLSELTPIGASSSPIFDLQSKRTKTFLTINNINGVIKRWCTKAGINKHITSYCCRHTFCVRLLKTGTDLKTVADAMGHRNLNTTARYLNHITDIRNAATSSLS